MEVYKQHGLLCLIWVFLFGVGLLGILILQLSQDYALQRIGQSGASTGIPGGDDFLEIKDAYQRMLARSIDVASSLDGQMAREQAFDFCLVSEKGNRFRRFDGEALDNAMGFPLEFPIADSLWMAGRKSEAQALLRRIIGETGLLYDEKNLLTASGKK